jgi:hypothetical protein
MGYRTLGGQCAICALATFILAAAGTAAGATAPAANDEPTSSTPAAAVAPDTSDTLSGAQPVPERLGHDFIATIDRPGDVDWYSLRGLAIGEPSGVAVTIAVVSTGLDCAASPPLLVLLRNPEGKWIRTYAVSSSITQIPVPSLPSRYYLEVRAADYGCVGLQYKFPGANPVGSAGGGGGLVASAVLCRIAHDDRVAIDTQIRTLMRTRAAVRSAAARRRYTRYVKQQRHELKRARAEERRTCAKA